MCAHILDVEWKIDKFPYFISNDHDLLITL